MGTITISNSFYTEGLSKNLENGLSHYLPPFLDLEKSLEFYIQENSLIYVELFLLRVLVLDQEKNDFSLLPEYLQMYVSDCFILTSDFESAEMYFPKINLGGRSSLCADKIINIKLINHSKINAGDLLSLFGPKTTKTGLANLEKITCYLQVELDKVNLPNYLSSISDIKSQPFYALFPGLGNTYYLNNKCPTRFARFSESDELFKLVRDLTRKAENSYRIENNIPKIGEGWISETILYNEIKGAFPNYEVIQHASPIWLGKQHLDIFIPDLSVAIEYQGIQHYKPIVFFGGTQGYQATLQRDKKKQNLCKRHKVNLIYVTEGVPISEVLENISYAGEKGR